MQQLFINAAKPTIQSELLQPASSDLLTIVHEHKANVTLNEQEVTDTRYQEENHELGARRGRGKGDLGGVVRPKIRSEQQQHQELVHFTKKMTSSETSMWKC